MKSIDRRESIVHAAKPLFAKKGFKATTTKEIAQASGVSEALLYKHFPSKTHLYKEIQSHCCKSSIGLADKIVELEPGTQTLILGIYAMTYFILRGTDGEEDNIMTKRLVLSSLREDGEFANEFLENHMRSYIFEFTKCFEVAFASGDLTDTGTCAKDLTWYAHHLAVCTSFYSLPEIELVNLDSKDQELIASLALFSLRGMGLKEQAIQKYFNPNKFKEFLS